MRVGAAQLGIELFKEDVVVADAAGGFSGFGNSRSENCWNCLISHFLYLLAIINCCSLSTG